MPSDDAPDPAPDADQPDPAGPAVDPGPDAEPEPPAELLTLRDGLPGVIETPEALAAYAALLRAYSVYLVPTGPAQAPERLSLADLLVPPSQAAALLGLSEAATRSTLRRHGVTERRGYLPQDVAFVLHERGGEPDDQPIGDPRRGAATYRRLRTAIGTEVARALPGVNGDAAAKAADAALAAMAREFADVPAAGGPVAA